MSPAPRIDARTKLFHGLMLLASVLLLDVNVVKIRAAMHAHAPVPVIRYIGTVFWIAMLVFFVRSLWQDLRGSHTGDKVV